MAPVSKKRAAVPGAATAAGSKRVKSEKKAPPHVATAAAGVAAGGSLHASAPPFTAASSSSTVAQQPSPQSSTLKQRFLDFLQRPEYQTSGVSNSVLKREFGPEQYLKLVDVINELNADSRLTMSRLESTGGGEPPELCYNLVSPTKAHQLAGLDVKARLVHQVIERAGDLGIWTKEIRLQTNIPQQALNKIFKALENRRLIKPVKSVTAKAKKLYMLYDLQPSKELTGGVWYSDLEFDHEFISELRTFLLHCVRRLHGGRGMTLTEIRDKMLQANVSRVPLSLDELKQLLQTLVYDYLIEESQHVTDKGEVLYVASKRITPMCEFKWWEDALATDFHFRDVEFEDGVVLSAHEPHYTTL